MFLGNAQPCKTETDLLAARRAQGAEVVAHLEGSWAATPATVGDAVNLVADVYQHEGSSHAVVDDRAGLLVLHPDLLLSGAGCSFALCAGRQWSFTWHAPLRLAHDALAPGSQR